MIKKNILFFIFLLLLIFSFSVTAEQNIINNFQLNTADNGLTIVYPKDVYYTQNDNIELHFHVVNNVSEVLTVAEFDCFIHLYDSSNNHVLINNLSDGSNNYDKEILINSSITSSLGEKPYNIFCNSTSGLFGFVSGKIFITRNGEEYNVLLSGQNNNFLLFGFLSLAIVFLIISYLFKGEEKGVKHLRGLFFYLSMVHLLIISLIISTVTSCTGGLCGDINRFGVFGEVYTFIMASVLIYVLYTYSLARVTSITESKKK